MGPIKADLPVLHALTQKRNKLSVSSKQRKRIQPSKEVDSGEMNSSLKWVVALDFREGEERPYVGIEGLLGSSL